MNFTKEYLPFVFRTRSMISMLILMGLLLAGFFVAQFVAALVVLAITGSDFTQTFQLLSPPYTGQAQWNALMATQIASSIVIFVGVPLFYLFNIDRVNQIQKNDEAVEGAIIDEPMGETQRNKSPLSYLFRQYGKMPLAPAIALTILIVLVYMPLSAWTVYWNEAFVFPESMYVFEQLAKELEESAKQLTMFLVDFEYAWQFAIGVFAIAIIPGVGEELLFRGVLQNKLQILFKNSHVAIWVAAFIFSAFHFQFYGLVPRMLLGALFGYLYIWSGNLLIPMVAHFFNNAFTLVMMHLYNQDLINTNIDTTEEIPLTIVLLSLAAVTIGLFAFRQYHAYGGIRKPENQEMPTS